MNIEGRFSLSSAALARMRAVRVVQHEEHPDWTAEDWEDYFVSLNASHRASMVDGKCQVDGCGASLIDRLHVGTNYFCLHQMDGNQEPCPQGCNSFGHFA